MRSRRARQASECAGKARAAASAANTRAVPSAQESGECEQFTAAFPVEWLLPPPSTVPPQRYPAGSPAGEDASGSGGGMGGVGGIGGGFGWVGGGGGGEDGGRRAVSLPGAATDAAATTSDVGGDDDRRKRTGSNAVAAAVRTEKEAYDHALEVYIKMLDLSKVVNGSLFLLLRGQPLAGGVHCRDEGGGGGGRRRSCVLWVRHEAGRAAGWAARASGAWHKYAGGVGVGRGGW